MVAPVLGDVETIHTSKAIKGQNKSCPRFIRAFSLKNFTLEMPGKDLQANPCRVTIAAGFARREAMRRFTNGAAGICSNMSALKRSSNLSGEN